MFYKLCILSSFFDRKSDFSAYAFAVQVKENEINDNAAQCAYGCVRFPHSPVQKQADKAYNNKYRYDIS